MPGWNPLTFEFWTDPAAVAAAVAELWQDLS